MSLFANVDRTMLATLRTAVQAGTLDAAARELHVTPSAVSQRIKQLESQVGRVLLHRTKPIRPTEAGRVLLRMAGQLAVIEAEALAELIEDAPGMGEELPWVQVPLAVNADTIATWLLEAMIEVQARHRVSFELVREDEGHTATRLRQGEVLAAVTADPQPVTGCHVVRLGTMRYRAVASPSYRERYLPDGVTAAGLATAPVVNFDRADTMQREFLRKVTRKHLAPPSTYIPSVHDFDAAVRRGMGWGLLLESQVGDDLETGKLVELYPGRHQDVPLYWQHWKFGSRLMDDLTDAVRRSAAAWLTPES